MSVVRRSRLPRVPTAFSPTAAVRAVERELPPLVVLCAQRGYGKTSTVAYWLRNGELDSCCAVWVTPPQAATGVELWAGLHEELVGIGLAEPSGAPDHRSVGRALQRLSRRLVMVIDGLDHVRDTDVDARLVELTQEHELLHLVVTSRGRRPVESLGPATVDTALLHAAELALDAEHTALLASRLGLELTVAEAKEFVDQLAGWPAMLRAIVLESRRAPDGRLLTDTESVGRYVTMVLGDAESAPWRHVVTALAVAEKPEPGDLSVLLPEDEAQAAKLLAHSAESDAVGYPAEAREALLDVLRTEEPERYRRMHEALAHRRHRQNRHAEALDLAARAETWELALEVWEESWPSLLREHPARVASLLSLMPREIADSSASLALARCYVVERDIATQSRDALREGRLRPTEELTLQSLTTVERLARSVATGERWGSDSNGAPDRSRGLPEHIAQAMPETIVSWALALLVAGDELRSPYYFTLGWREAVQLGQDGTAADAAAGAALCLALLGHLVEAQEWLDVVGDSGPHPEALAAGATRAARTLLATQRLEAAPEMPEADRHSPTAELARLATAEQDVMEGRLDRARAVLERYTDGDTTLAGVWATMLRVDLALADGRLDRAGAILADGSISSPAARARHAFYVGAHAEVIRLTEGAAAEANVRPRVGMELLLLRACAAWRLERPNVAIDSLAAAVGIATDTGLLMPFRTVPRAELESIAEPGSWYRDFLDRHVPATVTSPFPSPRWVSELSAAELRVLRELAAGDPLVVIARRLFISESTVKTHVRRIYRKLDATSRTSALERAGELSLLA